MRSTKYTHETAEQRSARVARVREEILAGTYETTTRLAAAVEALADDLEDRVESVDDLRRKPR